MNAKFTHTKKGTWAYIQKKVRVDGKSTTLTIKRLGLVSDIEKKYGCSDGQQWARDLAAKMTKEEMDSLAPISVEFCPDKLIKKGEMPLRTAGDVFLLPLYNKLGLPEICKKIAGQTRIEYDLNMILQTLVCGRILFPCSKIRTQRLAANLVRPPKFQEQNMYRALTLLSEHINDIQAEVYKNSKRFTQRRDRVIYYDCSNFYFEIEDNDTEIVNRLTGEVRPGLRCRGKSKEHRPNPIVQMGLFMDMDGIPLAFVIFPGNKSEQTSLQPLEKILDSKFGMTEFVVSTDAGLGSEDNRRYNMAEGRDYICVQSIPSLKETDRAMVLRPEGWKISWCKDDKRKESLIRRYAQNDVFNLDKLIQATSTNPGLLKDITLFKEIIVEKSIKYLNPEWTKLSGGNPNVKPKDKNGKPIPQYLTSKRNERVIVTYSHDFALFLKHKRQLRLAVSEKIVSKKVPKNRQSQQSPLTYVKTVYKTADGQVAEKIEMSIDQNILDQEEKLDGFYAYGTSLEDDAIDVLRIRSFHHEIEHLFRTTKTHLNGRPVYLSRSERICSHFLICFLAMVILKLLQKELSEKYKEEFESEPLTIDSLVETLQEFKFGRLPNLDYQPMYMRTTLTDKLLNLYNLALNTEIVTKKEMGKIYANLKKS